MPIRSRFTVIGYLLQIANALEYLRKLVLFFCVCWYNIFSLFFLLDERGLIHGDLKPPNILITQDKTTIKLCDFGSSQASLKVDSHTPGYTLP